MSHLVSSMSAELQSQVTSNIASIVYHTIPDTEYIICILTLSNGALISGEGSPPRAAAYSTSVEESALILALEKLLRVEQHLEKVQIPEVHKNYATAPSI